MRIPVRGLLLGLVLGGVLAGCGSGDGDGLEVHNGTDAPLSVVVGDGGAGDEVGEVEPGETLVVPRPDGDDPCLARAVLVRRPDGTVVGTQGPGLCLDHRVTWSVTEPPS